MQISIVIVVEWSLLIVSLRWW